MTIEATGQPRPRPVRSRRGRLAALLSVLLLAVAACGDDGENGGGGGDRAEIQDVSLLLGAPTYDLGFVIVHVAEEAGFFEEEGLSVDVQAVGGSTDAFQQVAEDTAEFAWGTPEPLIVGAQPGRGLDLTNVYTVLPEDFYFLAAPEGSGIEEMADLEGTTVGFTNLASGAVPVVRAWLTDAGLEPEADVTLAAIGAGPQAVAAFEGGEADAMGMWDTVAAGLGNLGLPVTEISDQPVGFPSSLGVVARQDFVEESPELVEAFGRALAKATVLTREDPEAAVELAWASNPDLEPTDRPREDALADGLSIVEARLESMETDDPLGHNPPEGYAEYATFLYEQGVLDEEVDGSELVTNEFVDAYNDFDVDEVIERLEEQ